MQLCRRRVTQWYEALDWSLALKKSKCSKCDTETFFKVSSKNVWNSTFLSSIYTAFYMFSYGIKRFFFYDFQLVLDETYQHKIEPGCRHILAFDILTCRIYPHVFTLESKVCLSWGIVLPLYNHKPYPMLKPPGFHCVSGELRTELT